MNEQQERTTGISMKAWTQIVGAVLVLLAGYWILCIVYPIVSSFSWFLGYVVAAVFVVLAVGVMGITAVAVLAVYVKHVETPRITARKFSPSANNSYAVFLDEKRKTFVQATNGELPAPRYDTYSPAIHNHNDVNAFAKMLEMGRTDVQQIAGPEENKPVPTARQLLQDGTVKRTIEGGEIILGFLEDGSMKTLPYDLLYSTDLGGVGGSGKTTTAYWLCVQEVIAGTRLIVVDPHLHVKRRGLAQGLGQMLAPYKHSYHFAPCDDNPGGIIERARWMRDENKRRQGPGVDLDAEPQIMMVVDEFNSIIEIQEIREELGDIIATVQREGRKLGLFFLLVGHRWSQQDIGNIKIRTNAATVMAHYYNDADQAGKLLGGQGKLCQTLKAGSYWMRGLMTGDLMKVFTPMIDENDTALILDVMGQPATYPTGKTVEGNTSSAVLPQSFQSQQWESAEDGLEVNGEAAGSEKDTITDLSTIKTLREIGKRLRTGEEPAKIVKSFGLPYGRATQEMSAVVEMVSKQIEMEG